MSLWQFSWKTLFFFNYVNRLAKEGNNTSSKQFLLKYWEHMAALSKKFEMFQISMINQQTGYIREISLFREELFLIGSQTTYCDPLPGEMESLSSHYVIQSINFFGLGKWYWDSVFGVQLTVCGFFPLYDKCYIICHQTLLYLSNNKNYKTLKRKEKEKSKDNAVNDLDIVS